MKSKREIQENFYKQLPNQLNYYDHYFVSYFEGISFMKETFDL